MKYNLFSDFRIPFLLFVFTACSTARINICVLQPAKISIPSTIHRISLFPGAGIPDPPGVFDSICNIDLKPDYNFNRSKRGYMEGVYEIMSASPRFKKVVLSDSSFENLLTTGVLSWDQLRQVCTHDSTDAVLLLRKAVSMDTVYYIDNVMQYRIINITKWAFYEPFSERTADELKMNDTSYFEHDVYHWNTKINSRDVPALLYDACYSAGNKLGNQISPAWNDHNKRILYSGPGEPLKQAFSLAKYSQWHQAGAIWNDLANSTDTKQASRASFNLALAWEQDDDIEQAIIWISYADSLRHTKKTKAYRQILELRLKNKAELDLQMNGK